MEESIEKGRRFILVLFLAATCFAVLQVGNVRADTPNIISVQPWMSGTNTILNITITHDTGAPTGSHYVDTVQVNIDGVVHDISLTSQSTVTFIVQYDMGVVSGMPTVQARAHCTVHGWSSWSNTVQVPEFSLIMLLPVLAVLTIAITFLWSTAKNRNETRY